LIDGRQYVGSAYGDVGLWSRWATYVYTKDGGNKEMRALNKATNGGYIDGARFTLLEAWPMRTEDNLIIEREDKSKLTIEFSIRLKAKRPKSIDYTVAMILSLLHQRETFHNSSGLQIWKVHSH